MAKQIVITLSVPNDFTWANVQTIIGQNVPQYDEPVTEGGDTLWPDEDTDPEGNFPEGCGSWDVYQVGS